MKRRTWEEIENAPTPTSAKELADRIAVEVDELDWVSPGDLIRRIGPVMRGDMCVTMPDRHLVLFVGFSEMACDAIELLRNEKPHRVHLCYLSPLCHFIDGSPLVKNMPWAKPAGLKRGYKKDHYLSTGMRPCRVDPCDELCGPANFHHGRK